MCIRSNREQLDGHDCGVPQQQLGFAYGIASSVISIALIIEPTFVGHLKVSTGSYEASDFLFIALGICGWLMNVVIGVVDIRGKRILSRPSKYLHQKSVLLSGGSATSYGSVEEAVPITPRGRPVVWAVCAN